LSSFAGCFEKEVGVEYADCFLSTAQVSNELVAWLDDSVNGVNRTRTLMVRQVSSTLTVAATMTLSGFLREFSISPAQAGEKGQMTASFVIVPDSVTTNYNPGGVLGNTHATPILMRNSFRFKVEGTTLNETVSVAGMRLSWQKVLTGQVGGRNVYGVVAGAPASDDITLTVSQNSASGQYLNSWFAGVVSGGEAPRTATLEMLSPTLTTVHRTFTLSNLTPRQFLPFSTSTAAIALRTMTIQNSGFQIQ